MQISFLKFHFTRLAIALLCIIGAATCRAAVAELPAVVLPDTPVGKALSGWLQATNTGDRDTVHQFLASHMAAPPNGVLPIDGVTNRRLARFKETGGYEVRKINNATDDNIAVVVQDRRFGYWTLLQMAVAPAEPHGILGTSEAGTEPPTDLLPKEKLSESELRDHVDALVSKLVAADVFSGVILIAKDGNPIYQRAAGMANRQWNIANRVDTKFNLASIGKMFTAAATMQLVEQGKLTLDDTVGKILPDYANAEVAQHVTIRQLLSHTAGIHSAPGSEDLFARHYRNVNDYLPSFAAQAPAFAPGSKFAYSNEGYYLLAAIVEKAAGQSYYDYVREHIFKAAGMNDTDNYDLETDPPNLATGYMDGPGGKRLSNTMHLPVRGVGCGLGYATAPDMVKFQLALQHHVLLNEQSLNTLWTGITTTPRDGKYGLGCYVTPVNNTRIIWHGGGWVGITNQFDMYPDLGYTVVILNNIDSSPTPLALTIRGWLTQGSH